MSLTSFHHLPARASLHLRKLLVSLGTTSLLLLGAAPVLAAGEPAPPGAANGGGARKGPPAEAMAACKGLSAGQACNFKGPRGEQRGSCWAPADKPLACKPSAPPAAK